MYFYNKNPKGPQANSGMKTALADVTLTNDHGSYIWVGEIIPKWSSISIHFSFVHDYTIYLYFKIVYRSIYSIYLYYISILYYKIMIGESHWMYDFGDGFGARAAPQTWQSHRWPSDGQVVLGSCQKGVALRWCVGLFTVALVYGHQITTSTIIHYHPLSSTYDYDLISLTYIDIIHVNAACSRSSFEAWDGQNAGDGHTADPLQIRHRRSDGGSMVHPERPDRCRVAATHAPGCRGRHPGNPIPKGIVTMTRNHGLISAWSFCKENLQRWWFWIAIDSRNSIADKPCLYK